MNRKTMKGKRRYVKMDRKKKKKYFQTQTDRQTDGYGCSQSLRERGSERETGRQTNRQPKIRNI